VRVGVVASHAWPLPSPARGGDSQILLDLTRSLAELGHEVYLDAPEGTSAAEDVVVREMPHCSMGQAEPTTKDCEGATRVAFGAELSRLDIIHDCSVEKLIAKEFPHKSLSTIWGGHAHHPSPPRNIVAQSHAQAARLAKGLDDYNNPGGPSVTARVVWNGIDCEAYKPTGKPKQDFFLMFGRWHPVRGIPQAIELAKATGINLLIAGEDPERDHPYQADYARQMCELARGCDNISVEFLPADPLHHERKVELYSDARALLFLPQFEEPFGLPQVEAMACGTPVIGADRGSVPEINDYGSPGFVDDEDTATFATVLWTIATGSQAEAATFSKVCRQRAVEHFDRMVMARNYVKLYEEVCGGGGW
jgi:glycosyltransferase involved in cell wall biosynthesis